MITIKDTHILLDQSYSNAEEAICLIQVPDGVDFGTGTEPQVATVLFVVALKEKQLEVLQDIAFFCSDIDNVMALSDAKDLQAVQNILLNS